MPGQRNSFEWFKKSEIDYVSSFIKLWLSFNALYKRLFQHHNLGCIDREYIEKLKVEDNAIKRRFIRLFSEESDEAKEFQLHLSELIRKYDGGLFGGTSINRSENVKPQLRGAPVNELSFKSFLHKSSTSLQRCPQGYIKMGRVYFQNLPDEIWPYFLELIYMIRNSLVHGELIPSDESQEIIKACYSIIYVLIKHEV